MRLRFMKKSNIRKSSINSSKYLLFLFLVLILSLSFVVRIYRLAELMPFIGDFAWFYLSARDFILTGQIPLVGITSSQTWLHQGPYWTYLLSVPLLLSNYHPLSGGYLSAILGTLTVYLIYRVGSMMFSIRVGLIAAALFACSPLVIFHSRMPYHTSVIPLFATIFIYVFYRWAAGSVRHFTWVIFLLGILYNFELATTVLWFLVAGMLVYGFFNKKRWVFELASGKVLVFSSFAFVISMLPILIYDFSHEFVQTAKFAHWVIYHKIFLGFLSSAQGTSFDFSDMLAFLAHKYQQLIFFKDSGVAAFMAALSFVWIITKLSLMVRYKKPDWAYLSLFLFTLVATGGFIFNGVESEAYVPLLFPPVIFLTALSINSLIRTRISLAIFSLLILLIATLNTYFFVASSYSFTASTGFASSIKNITEIAEVVIELADDEEYVLNATGAGSEHASFTNNIEYVTWWLGNPPVKNALQEVIIYYDKDGIHINRKLHYNSNR